MSSGAEPQTDVLVSEAEATEPEAALDELAEDVEEKLPQYFYEMYRMAVDMADRVSARRTTANAFFATVNTALLAIVGSQDLVWYVPLAGMALAWTWLTLLRSYRDLNDAKFKIINAVEERLPIQVFGDEWTDIESRRKVRPGRFKRVRQYAAGYKEQGQVERRVPWVFGFLYLIALATEIAESGWIGLIG